MYYNVIVVCLFKVYKIENRGLYFVIFIVVMLILLVILFFFFLLGYWILVMFVIDV